jgi:hypothetical protein
MNKYITNRWCVLGFILGALLSFSEVYGIVGYAVSTFISILIAVLVGAVAGPLAWLVLFLVIPLAFIINGLMGAAVVWLLIKFLRLIIN